MTTVAWIATHAGAILFLAFVCHGTGSLVMGSTGRDAPLGGRASSPARGARHARRWFFVNHRRTGCPAEAGGTPAPLLRAAAATALGMGLLGQTLFVLGLVGALTRTSVLVTLGLMAAASVVAAKVRPAADVGGATLKPAAPLILLGTLPAFLLALYPPVGFDATMYHLPFAKAFAREGALVFLDNLRFPVFPQLAEMLFTAALLVADDVTAQLTQWLAVVVTAFATFSLGDRLGGRRAALFAAALVLGTPLAVFLGGNAYIDATLMMAVTLALCAWLEWRRTASTGWLVLAGAFAGMGAATKYHGLFFVVAFLLAAVRIRLRAGAVFLLAALLFAAPWYAHIAHHTGNPLFPFLSAVFGRSEWQTVVDASLERAAANPIAAVAADPVSLASGAVRGAIIDPVEGGRPPHSPWLLVLLPLGIAGAFLERRLLYLFAAAVVYALLMSSLDWRFMIAVVPLVAVCIALALDRLVTTKTALVTALLILPGFAWGSLLIVRHGPIPTTPAERDAFVARTIPAYRALRVLNQRHGANYTAYVLYAPNAAYYCDGRFLGDHFGPYRYSLVQRVRYEPEKLHALLRRFGADYIIFTEPLKVDRVPPP